MYSLLRREKCQSFTKSETPIHIISNEAGPLLDALVDSQLGENFYHLGNNPSSTSILLVSSFVALLSHLSADQWLLRFLKKVNSVNDQIAGNGIDTIRTAVSG